MVEHNSNSKLEGLSEKIFLDRYAWKNADVSNAKVGDIVLVLTKDDPKFPTKEVGEIMERQGETVTVRMRSGDIIDASIEKLTLTIEQTPEEMWRRLAKAMSSVETDQDKQEQWQKNFEYILKDWKLVPGGRIAAGAGASDELTLFNCYVVPSPRDSRGGIMQTLSEMTEIMARGGGVGMNLSSLRPRRAIVAGVNGASSGSVSWGGLFSYTTGLIEQGGSRRGALMLMMNDWHPDVLEFITVKQTSGQVTNANLSVCVSHAFMNAVKHDLDWELVFPDTKEDGYDELWDGDLGQWRKLGKRVITYKTVKAREIWHSIIESAWKSAEPGVVFMEYYNEMSNSWYFNPIISTNPCFHPKTRITTEHGLITIEELYQKTAGKTFMVGTDMRLVEEAKVVGGSSYSSNGVKMRPATVIPTGIKETVVVTLQNGMEISVTGDHRLYTSNGWKAAQQLTADDFVYVQSGKGSFAAVDDIGKDSGLKLGWMNDDHGAEEASEAMFTSTEETTTAFLQGLFCRKATLREGGIGGNTINLHSSSKKLLQNVQLLLLNYGIHSSIHNRSSESYDLILTGDNIPVFKEQIGFRPMKWKQQALERIAHLAHGKENFLSRVVEVQAGEITMVYDITEQVTHSLLANGFVAHNCGEQGLPGWGVCNLSAVNLSTFYDEQQHDVDWDELATVTRWSVRFLDNVIDVTPYHFPENEANQKLERRIGLGTMGLAELMIKLEIRYGSAESLKFLDKLYRFMAREAYLASSEIAAEKGAFQAFDAEKYLQSGFMQHMTDHFPEIKEAIRAHGIRNVTILTQAPTGSTGTMVGTSTGIEPYFAFEYFRQSRLGYDRQFVPIVQSWRDVHPGEELPDYFVTAMTLSAEDHIRVQAAIQRWVDSSISKTANAPADFTVEDTKQLYELAYELSCKGVTIYRDGSRDEQVLSAAPMNEGELDAETVKEAALAPEDNHVHLPVEESGEQALDRQYKRRPQVLRGATYKINTPFGMAYITINDLKNTPAEIFLNVGKAGSDVFAMAEALGRVCSLFLRYGEHGNKVSLLIKHLKGIGGSGAIGFGVNRVESIADAVAKALEMHIEGLTIAEEEHMTDALQTLHTRPLASGRTSGAGDEAVPMPEGGKRASADLCPSCGSASLMNVEGCKQCRNCGYSRCN